MQNNSTENEHLAYLQQCIGLQAKDRALSPLSRWLDGKLLFAEAGHLKFSFIVREEWMNPSGTLHGGMAAALIDDIIGTTIYSMGSKEFYVTVNLQLDYLSFALLGDEIVVEAKAVRKGITVINMEAFIWKRKKLLVKATSNLVNSGKAAY